MSPKQRMLRNAYPCSIAILFFSKDKISLAPACLEKQNFHIISITQFAHDFYTAD